MRFKIILMPLIFLVVATSCSVNKQLVELENAGSKALSEKNYEQAFAAFDSIISINKAKGKETSGVIYRDAGIAAYELGNTKKAIEYIEQAKGLESANALAYFSLAKVYLKIDNLSREIINLDTYLEKYPEGEDVNQVRCQLYIAYVKSENWSYASSLWNGLNENCKSTANVLKAHLKELRQGEDWPSIMLVAKKLLKLEKNNLEAKEALALGLYTTSEESYQTEMKAYQKNRTNSQYRRLLKELEIINANFKQARDIFEELYKIKPESKYATYLGNIYTRFENKKRATYYYNKAKQ